MNGVVGYTGDDTSGLKEAKERAEEEQELRRQYLARKYGRSGAEKLMQNQRRIPGRGHRG